MKIHGKLKTALVCFGAFSIAFFLTAGFTGFDIIRLAGNIIQDSGGTARITLSTSSPEITLTGDLSFSGTIVQPGQPSFYVNAQSVPTNVTGDGTIWVVEFDNEVYDQTASFATSTFTALTTGKYFFTAHVLITDATADFTSSNISLVTSNRVVQGTNFQEFDSLENELKTYDVSAIVDMDENDTAHLALQISGGNKVIELHPAFSVNYFSGSLIN